MPAITAIGIPNNITYHTSRDSDPIEIDDLRDEQGRRVKLSVSIGVASLIPNMEDSRLDLLRHADQVLYSAKEAGRDRVMVYSRSADTST